MSYVQLAIVAVGIFCSGFIAGYILAYRRATERYWGYCRVLKEELEAARGSVDDMWLEGSHVDKAYTPVAQD